MKLEQQTRLESIKRVEVNSWTDSQPNIVGLSMIEFLAFRFGSEFKLPPSLGEPSRCMALESKPTDT
jgi:hypothetical protein